MQTTLRDFDGEDSPLLLFDCGHSLLMSNTDTMFEMAEICYLTEEGHWKAANPLGDNSLQIPSCPTCKVSLDASQRYNRRVNWVNLNKSGLKYNKKNEGECSKLLKLIAKLTKECATLFDKFKQRPLPESLLKNISNLTKKMKQAKVPSSQHPLLIATSVIQRQDALPSTVNTDASAFEKAKTSLAAEYLKLLVTCMQYRASFNPSTKSQGDQMVKIVSAEALEDIVRRVETLYEESIALSVSSRTKLGEIKVVLLDLSYRVQLRENLPKLYNVAGDLPELDVIKRIHSLSGQQLEDRPGKILHIIDEFEKLVPSDALREMRKQAQAFAKSLASPNITPDELKMIFDVMKADVGSAMASFGGHWYCYPNGHPYAIGEVGGAMERSTCPQCGATIGGSSHRLTAGNKVYEPLASKQFGYVRGA